MLAARFIPWTLAALLLGVFFALGAVGWPGEFVGAGDLFCEAFHQSWVKQPANTWSNLGFVAAGLWIATHSAKRPIVEAPDGNAFSRSLGMPLLYAALVIFIGPGSMALHGSGHAWGHTVDVLAMFTFIMFPVAWGATRFLRGGERMFWCIYLPVTIALAVLHASGTLPFSGIALYAVLIPIVLAIECALHFRRPAGERRAGYMLATVACFAAAVLIWRLSLTDAPLCDPSFLVQGHAIWHVLCAVTTVCLFLAYVTEESEARYS